MNFFKIDGYPTGVFSIHNFNFLNFKFGGNSVQECNSHGDYAYPMPVYRPAHTTGKAAFGGRHEGLFKLGYQVFTSLRVMYPP